MSKLFSRGLSSGEQFCNRIEETTLITQNIENGTHTLLISPRRYGKTSLALHVIDQLGLPYCHIDLFMKWQSNEIIAEFCRTIGSLSAQVLKPTKKALRTLEQFFKHIKISLTLGAAGIEFSLLPTINEAYCIYFFRK